MSKYRFINEGIPDSAFNRLKQYAPKNYVVDVYRDVENPLGYHYEINSGKQVYTKVKSGNGFLGHFMIDGKPQNSVEEMENYAKKLIDRYDCQEVSNAEYERIVNESLKEDLNRTFVELETFKKSWDALGLSDNDLRDLQNLILTHPDVAVSLGSNVFKVRFSPRSLNKGKNTATRVIYVDIIKDSRIYLVTAFSKSSEQNITSNKLEAIKNVAKEL